MSEADDFLKFSKAIKNFGDMLEKPKTSQAIERLSTSMDSLSGQLMNLNTAVINQNERVRESIKQTKEESIALREELKKLTMVSGKSHSIFESLERSAKSADELNRVVMAFTFVSGAVGIYTMLKDVSCGNGTASCDYQSIQIVSIFSAFSLLIILRWISGKKK